MTLLQTRNCLIQCLKMNLRGVLDHDIFVSQLLLQTVYHTSKQTVFVVARQQHNIYFTKVVFQG